MLLLPGLLAAQLAMTRSPFNGSYSTLTTGGGATAVAGVASTDDGTGAVPIGFTFNYLGTGYTTATACVNGWLSFGTQSGSSWVNTNLYTVTTGPTLAPWWDDLYAIAVGSNPAGQILYQTTGTLGSQVCTVQWDVSAYTSGTPRFIHFQVKLYEGTNVIEFLYNTPDGGTVTNTGESASIGIKNNTGGPGNYLDGITGSSRVGNGSLQSENWPTYFIRFTPGAPSALPGGTYDVGVGQTYRNLTEAVADVNQRGVSGAVTFNLTDAQYDVTSANGANQFPIFFGPVPGTSATNTITLTKSGTAAIIAHGGAIGTSGFFYNGAGTSISASNVDPIVGLVGTDFLTLNNLDIRGDVGNLLSDYGIGIYNNLATDGATNNIIQNVSVRMNRANTGSRGFFSNVTTTPTALTGANSNNTFRDFTIKSVFAGIQFTGNATWPDVNTQIINSSCTAFNTIGDPATANDIGNGTGATYGIQLTNLSGFTVSNNSIRNLTNTSTGQTDGINIVTFQGNSTIANNRIRTIRGTATASVPVLTGIRATHTTTGTHALRIFNNAISDIASSFTGTATTTRAIKGMFMSSTAGANTQSYEIWNNSVSIDGSASPNLSNTAFESSNAITGPVMTIKNNVFSNSTGAQGATARHYAFVHTNTAAQVANTGTSVTNNDVYVPNDAGTSGFTALAGAANQNGAATWATAVTTGQVASNIEADPVFTNSTSDLHAGAAALFNTGAALPGYITVDNDCVNRSGQNDIGAFKLLACSGAPTAGTITGAATACSATPPTLTLTGMSTGLGISYQWSYGPPGTPGANLLGTGTSQSAAAIPNGTWEVQVTVTCSGFGSTSTAPFAFTKNQTPSASASSNSPACIGLPLNLIGITDVGATFSWTGPSAYSSSAQSPTVSASATSAMAGIYTFTASANGCTSTPATTTVAVNPTPVVTITPPVVALCANPPNDQATLTASTAAYPALENVVAAVAANAASILTSYPSGSGFSLDLGTTATSISDGCNDMYDGGNFLNTNLATSIPYTNGAVLNSASFGAGGRYVTGTIGATACGTSPTVFFWAADINGLTSLSITGNLGADGGGAQNTTTFTVSASGVTYTALVKRVYNATDPSINQIFLIPQPNSATQAIGTTTDDNLHTISGLGGVTRFYYILFAGLSGLQYSDAQVQAVAQAAVNVLPNMTPTWSWSPNGETTASVTANAAGTYTATATVNGCSSSASRSVTMATLLTSATITPASPEYCAGGSVTLTATPTDGAPPYTYQWYNPSNAPMGTAQTQAANAPGVWTVTITDNCGVVVSGIASPTVVENPLPTASASSNAACSGQALNFTGTSNGSTFTWTGPAGFSSTLQSPSIASPTATNSGNYIFTAFSAAGCSSGPFTLPITVNPTPAVGTPTATPNPICTGGTSQLNVIAAVPGPVNLYTFAASSGTFVPLVGGTNVTAVQGDDVGSGSLPIGFTFSMDGGSYTNFYASSNGIISFGAANTSLTNALAGGVGGPIIAPLWDDLQGANGTFSYLTTGTPGSRVLTVEWLNWRWYYTVATPTISFQVKLYESDGHIDIIYRQEATALGGVNESASIGLAGVAGVYLSLNNTTASPVASTVAETTTINVKPASGQVYSFFPPSASVVWSPSTFLSNATITNPMASNVTTSTSYSVTATASGCTAVSPSVTLTVDPPPAATMAVVPDCDNDQWFLSFDVTSVGTGANVSFQYSVNGGAPVTIGPYIVGSVIPNIGPYTASDYVNVTLLHQSNTACNVSYGNFWTTCPYIITCPTTLPLSHCYGNQDTRTFLFHTNTPGETVTLSFVSGSMAPGDVIRAYSGTDNSGAPINDLTGFFANLAGASGTSTGQDLFLEIDSDNSNSCSDNQQAVWVMEAECTAGCVDPSGSITTSTNCANQQFSIDVEILFAGDAVTTTLEYTVNNGTPQLVPGLMDFDIQNIGPFNLGDQVQIRLLHETDAACDHNYGIFTVSPTACPNDEPCDARPVTVNPNYTCAVTTPGLMTGSTLTPGITGACTGVVQDEWFRFVATAPSHRIQLGGTTTGLSYALFAATSCTGPLTLVTSSGCNTGATVANMNGLTPGLTYYIRVSRTTVGTNAYTVCVSAPPAADIGQNALDFQGTTLGSNDRVNCGAAASVDITGNTITLEAWIYPTAWRASSFQGNIINRELPGFGGYMLRCGASGSLSFNLGNGTNWMEVISATNALTLNTWQHVAGTFDGTTLRIYRDGVLLTPASTAGTIAPFISATAAQPLTIGNWSQDNTRGFVGKIDEVRIWSTTLSQATLAANMNQQLCGGEAGLRAYYNFNQGVDGGVNTGITTLPDVSGNGNNGTLVNMALTGPTSNWVQGKTGMTACPPCATAPTAGSISGTSPVCQGTTTTLSLIGATTGTGISYQWAYGAVGGPYSNLLGTGLTQSTATIPVGTWEVVVNVTCSGFGTATTAPFSFVKNPTPTASASAGVACTGQTLQLTGTTDIGTTYAWTGPNSFTSALQNPTIPAITTAAAGTYTFTATLGSCSANGTVAVTVNTSPVLSPVTATPNPICVGGNSQLNALATIPGYTQSIGTFSVEPCQANAGPSGDDAVVNAPGITLPFTFTYFGVPYTNFTISTNGNLQMGNGSGTANNPAYSTSWTETAIPNAAVPNNMIALAWDDWLTTAGQITYGVIGTAPNRKMVVCYNNITGRGDGGSGTLDAQVVLEEGTNRILMNQTNISVTSNTTGFTVQGLEDATGSAISYSIPSRNNSASWTATNETRIFSPSQAAYSWSPATFLSATNIGNPVATGVTTTTPYTVTASANGCSVQGNVTLTANPALSGGSTITPASPYFCTGSSVTLTANPGGGGGPFTYTWTAPGGSPTLGAQTQVANIAGLWTVNILDNCGGSDQATINVTQFQTPTATASAGLACIGQSLALNGTTDIGTTYAWTGPNGFTSTSQNPSVSPVVAASAGTYSFTASTANCASAPSTVIVAAFASPTITTAASATPASICSGGNSQLNVAGNLPGYSVAPITFAPVTGTGIAGPAGDDVLSTAIPIGFSFNYYGNAYTDVYISTNGFISFDAGAGSGCCSGQSLPNALAPNNVIALAWEDLNTNSGGNIDYFNLTSPNRFVVRFNSVARFGSSGVVNGQIILFADGTIELHTTLVTSTDVTNITTQGIENAAGTLATVVSGRNAVNWTGGPDAYRFTPNTVSYSWTNPGSFLSATNIANPIANGVTTTPSVLYTATVTAGNGCSVSSNVTLTVNPLPVVSCGGPYGPYCVNDADVTLTATPAGGTWSGTGVTAGGIFDPSAGTQTLTYSYTDGNSCSSTCQVTITVFTADTDGDGIADCSDNCPNIFGQIGDACNAGPNFVLGQIDANCVCVGVSCSTDLNVVFQPDGVSNIGWQLRTQGTNLLVQSGSGIYPASPGYSLATCLPDGCYYLVVTDDGGDGITGGGYKLQLNGGNRVIDNMRDAFGNGGFSTGFTSQIAAGEGFCLPLGDDRLIYTSCDKMDWKTNPCSGEYVYANDNAVVSAQYGVNDANSGYQMWWFDPNGGYSFKRFQSHSTNNGLPAGATRACGFKLNSWAGNQLAQGVLYNVKVRGRVNGTYLPWGAACRLMVDNTGAQCPRTKLMDIPGNTYLSCGQFRAVATNVYVHARPVRRMNNSCNWINANRYQFRFRIVAESFVLVKTSATGQYFVNTNGLSCGKTYEVDVRASFDNGATWCNMGGAGLNDPAWGDVCMLTTTNCLTGGNQNLGLQGTGVAGELRMYPNPNRGDQLFINLTQVEEGVNTVSVDIYDGFGKRVAARTIAVQDGYVNTVLNLNGDLATGLYLVNITAGDQVHTERLVIQP